MLSRSSVNPLLYVLLLLLAGACIDPYRPPEIASPASYLVVNGFFNSAPGTTSTIQLSRTQNLTAPKAPVAESRAQVSIESQSKAVYPLREESGGRYTLSGVTPRTGETYRLHIRTAGGTEYFSEYVPVLTTPPIDSVSWRVENEGVQINVNTHDPTNNTRYYRWEYSTTWEYTTPFYSSYELKNNKVISREENINRCWSTEHSTNLISTSTTRLSKDVVSQFPILFVPGLSSRLAYKYSIEVRQYALSQAGFTYYDQLARITQNIGSLFDPQPSQITGNLYAVNNESNLVLGFFRVGTVETKRIFITSAQLPNWPNLPGLGLCVLDTMTLSELIRYQPAITITTEDNRYQTTSIDCVDCRLKGGTIQRPDFWK